MHVNIDIHIAGMEKELDKFEYKYIPAATRVGINRTVGSSKTLAKRTLYEAMNKAISMTKIAGHGAAAAKTLLSRGEDPQKGYLRSYGVSNKVKEVSRMRGKVYAAGGRISLLDHNRIKQHGVAGRPKKGVRKSRGKAGVTFASTKGGTEYIKSAFIAQMRNGHRGVFIRHKDASKSTGTDYRGRKRKNRLGLVQKQGPSINEIWFNHGLPQILLKKAETEFPLQFNRYLFDRLKKAGWRV